MAIPFRSAGMTVLMAATVLASATSSGGERLQALEARFDHALGAAKPSPLVWNADQVSAGASTLQYDFSTKKESVTDPTLDGGNLTSLHPGRTSPRLLGTLMPIEIPSSSPLNSICKVISVFPDGSSTTSTGVLIGDRFVLTAASTIYSRTKGAYAIAVMVAPGFSAKSHFPFGASYAASALMDQASKSEASAAPNWATLELNDPLGKQARWMGYSAAGNRESAAGAITGYSSSLNLGRQLASGFTSVSDTVDGDLMYADVAVNPGSIGAPYYVNWSVVGIVADAPDDYGTPITRLTAADKAWIDAFLAKEPSGRYEPSGNTFFQGGPMASSSGNNVCGMCGGGSRCYN